MEGNQQNEILYALDIIDEEELLLLYDLNRSKNMKLPYWRYNRLDLENLEGDECETYFRFKKNDILKLNEVFHIPHEIRCRNGAIFDGVEALCALLRRCAYPCRYADLIPMFGRSVPELCMATYEVLELIYNNFHHLLTSLDQPWLAPQNLQNFADTIHAKGAPLDNCWGFIDGTVRPICRPGERQRLMYNGHKRVHAIKFQSVATPNGLIAHMTGPFLGKRHDSGMLADSGLLQQLQQYSVGPTGNTLCLYGDPAYPLRRQLQGPFKGNNLTELQEQYNANMSSVRVSVEWTFNEVVNYFKFLDFKKNLKMNLSAVGKIYLVCALLTNAHTILYGSVTTSVFGVEPPTLEEYFQLPPL